jgi:dihydrodipicolinate reductase
MNTTITLLGAGGKMGRRITDNFRDSDCRILYVEINDAGIERLD